MRRLTTAVLTLVVLSSPQSFANPANAVLPQELTIELSSFKFTPSKLTLVRGKTYRLHFTNTSSGGHDFVAKEFFASASIAPEDQAKVSRGEIDLSGGRTADVTLIPLQAGTFKSHCSHFLHSSFGMKGEIVVQ